MFSLGSLFQLALIQTRHVIASLQKIYPNEKFEIREFMDDTTIAIECKENAYQSPPSLDTMTTMGDRVLNISLPKIGEKALFTKDLEDALHSGRVDFVVHSLKDLPTVLPAGLAIGAILEREDPRDALVLRAEFAGHTLQTLPAGSVVGTSSLRRGAQLARKYPQLVVQDIRGNLNTRLAKLDADRSKFAGIVLAQAGLERMGWSARINQTLDESDILYAVGQGALAVECRSTDGRILGMLQRLSCVRTQCRILTERSFLKTLGGGCSAPVAVVTDLRGGHGGADGDQTDGEFELHITGAVWSLDGKTEVQSKVKCALDLRAPAKPKAVATPRANEDESSGDSDEIVPTKRARLSGSDGDVDQPAAQPKKPDSPTIVDDTPAVPMPAGSDMSALLRIHGNLLTKCPYAAAHQRNGDADKCSLNMSAIASSVGQDVMGQCPYLNAEQKALVGVAMAETVASAGGQSGADVMGKCPISVEDRAKLVATSSQAAATASSPAASGCPFAKSAERSTTADAPDSSAVAVGVGCPFLKQAQAPERVQTPLENETAVEVPQNASQNAIICDEVNLFCGLFRHECYALQWFERCQQLGEQLAQTLIADGAMAVMEGAQHEIRKGASSS